MIVKLGLNKLQQLTRNYPRINIHFSRKFFDSSNPIDKQKIFLTDKYNSFRFNQIILFTHKLKNSLLTELNVESLNGRRVAVLCANNYTYLLSILAIWLARGVPVILNKSYPVNSLEYFLVDSKSELVINSFDPIEDYNYFKQSRLPELDILTQRLNIKKLTLFEHRFFRRSENNQSIYLENQLGLDDLIYKIQFNETNESDALIVYTSGSSGPPKGVVLTYKNVYNFVHTLNDCWKLSSNDKLLNVLPLNHIHGLIYSLLAPFLVGAEVDLMSKFNPQIVWLKLLDETNGINILTAVPTVYTKLVQFYYENEDLRQFYSKNKIRDIIGRKMRIMASASAPLDIKTSKEWVNLTGFKLIERYGLSEAGMVLSNSIFDRNPLENTVGKPYGNVNVRVCDSQNSDEILVQSDAKSNQVLTSKKDKITGELQIKGPILFKEYLNKAEETKESFTNDGWFKTGKILILVKYLCINV